MSQLRHPTPVLLGKSHGQRSLVGCNPWGRYELDTTERLHFHFSLSCIGEGNGNPLQCSCLENPRAGGAWWTAVYGVAQSGTRLKRLSSSSSSSSHQRAKSVRALASASVLPMNIQGCPPFRIDWFDLLAVEGTLKSLLQHHNSKTSILQGSAFFRVQFSHPYMTTKS